MQILSESGDKMYVFTVVNTKIVKKAIDVVYEPRAIVKVGGGGHKKPSYVALLDSHSDSIIEVSSVFCEDRGKKVILPYLEKPATALFCVKCGQQLHDVQENPGLRKSVTAMHPATGQQVINREITDIDVYPMMDNIGKPNGSYSIGKPELSDGKSALVLWRFTSRKNESSFITPGAETTVVAYDYAFHPDKKGEGGTAEMLAILDPGEMLFGHRILSNKELESFRLEYDGITIKVEAMTEM